MQIYTKMRWRCHLSSEWTQTCPCRGDLILAFKRLRLEDCHKFTATLGYRVTPCLRKQTKTRKTTRQTTRRKRHGAGEVTQWLRARVAPAENLLSAPSTHIYGRSLSFLTPVQEDPVPLLISASHQEDVWCACRHAIKMHIRIIK